MRSYPESISRGMDMAKIRGAILFMLIICAAFLASASSAAATTVVPFSQADRSGVATTLVGHLPIQIREICANRISSTGKKTPLRVLILFEPKSGAYAWIVTDGVALSNKSLLTDWFVNFEAAFLKKGRLFTFAARMAPLALIVHRSRSHVPNLQDAERSVLQMVAAYKDPPRELMTQYPPVEISITKIGIGFDLAPDNAMYGPQPKVLSVRWMDGNWVVTLKSRWIEVVTLSADYKLVRFERIQQRQ